MCFVDLAMLQIRLGDVPPRSVGIGVFIRMDDEPTVEARSASNRSIGVGLGPSSSDRILLQLLVDRLLDGNILSGR